MKRVISNGAPFRLKPEEFILEALILAGVHKFWPNRIRPHIRMVLSGNRYFVSDIESAEVIVGKLQECKRMTMRVNVRFPDTDQDRPGIIQYKMTKAGHKSSIRILD